MDAIEQLSRWNHSHWPKNQLLLMNKVVNRKRKNDNLKVIGYSSLSAHGSACIDLYKEQDSKNMNSNLHPRDTSSLKTLFQNVRLSQAATRRETFEDRGLGTIQDGYTTSAELEKICNYFMNQKSG